MEELKELKQKIAAKSSKVKRYDNRIKQFQDNRNFQTKQGKVFKNLEGNEEWTNPPNAEDATAFAKEYRVQKSSISRMQNGLTKQKKMPFEKQNTVEITKDDVKRKLKSMSDWKRAGAEKYRVFGKNFLQLYMRS